MITVDADPKTMILSVEAPPRLTDILARIPGIRAVGNQGRWEGPVTAALMMAVAKDLGSLRDFTPTDRATDLLRAIKDVQANVSRIKTQGLVGAYNDKLYDFQTAGVWMLLNRKGCLLGDEMGTGKTVQALTAARQVQAEADRPVATLVVAPNSMKHRWGRECETWFPEAKAVVLEGDARKKAKLIDEAKTLLDDGVPVVVSTNWESLRTLSRLSGHGAAKLTEKQKTPGLLQEIKWDIVIADEAHRAKDPGSQQTRALWYLGKDATYRWALTGTPTLNTPGDLWAIGRFYDPATFGESRHRWHNRFVAYIETRFGPKDIGLNAQREAEFSAWFDMNFIRRTTSEVLDLPDLRGGLLSENSELDVRSIEMTPQQKTAYNKMVKDMIVAINDDFLVANDPLSLLTRLSQIASATPVVEDMEVIALDEPSNKINAVMEILSEMDDDKQLVVFAQSRKLIELLSAKLNSKGIDHIQITGAVDPGRRDIDIQRFQAGERRVALATLAAGGTGIDLYAADTAVFMQRGYSFGDSLQAEARIYRNGQAADRVHIIDLVSKDTVDEAVIEALQSKGEMAEQVLRDKARHLLREKA